MNYFDVAVGLLLLLSVFRGYSTGLVNLMAGLVRFVIGVALALAYGGHLTYEAEAKWGVISAAADLFGDVFPPVATLGSPESSTASWLAGWLIQGIISIALVVVVSWCVGLLGKFISRTINHTPLVFLNRWGGGAMGAATSFFVLSLVVGVSMPFIMDTRSTGVLYRLGLLVNNSQLVSYLSWGFSLFSSGLGYLL